jgi:hypothetical protein
MNVLLYILSVTSLFAALNLLCRRPGRSISDRFMELLLAASGLLYLATLLPGLVGFLSPFTAGFTLTLLSLGLSFFLGRHGLTDEIRGLKVVPGHPSADTRAWNAPSVFLAAAGLAALIPMPRYLFRLAKGLFDSQQPLYIDVLRYHLPGFVEHYQTGTLWSAIINPFQSYSFGYEFISLYPAYFFQSHWSLYLADLFSVLILFTALKGVSDRFRSAAIYPAFFHPASVTLFVWGLWFAMFRPDKLHVGKNDIFMTGCIMASFLLLLKLMDTALFRTESRRREMIFLSGSALGLALATKPSSLLYVPLFTLMLACILYRAEGKEPGIPLKRAIYGSVIFLAVVLLFGGFFLLRNLVFYSSLADPVVLDIAGGTTLLENIGSPYLWTPSKATSLLLITILAWTWLVFLLIRHGKDQATRPILVALFFFLVTATVSMALTPFLVTIKESAGVIVLKKRSAMPLLCLIILIVPSVFRKGRARTDGSNLGQAESIILGEGSAEALPAVSARPGITPRKLLLYGLVYLILLLPPVLWQAEPARGLPGYQDRKGFSSRLLYSGIQELPDAVTVATVGSFPYPFYGRGWKNRVYDLSYKPPPRVSRLINDLKPDLVVVEGDHDLRIKRLGKVSEQLVTIYSDAEGAVFAPADSKYVQLGLKGAGSTDDQ